MHTVARRCIIEAKHVRPVVVDWQKATNRNVLCGNGTTDSQTQNDLYENNNYVVEIYLTHGMALLPV